jgi:hypothetical protein
MRLRSLDVLDVARGQTRSAPGPTSRSLLDAASASAACACRIGRTSAYLTKRPIRAGRQSRPEHPQPYPCDVREPKIGPQKRRLYPRPVQHVLSWLDAPGVRRPCKAVMPDTATALLIEVQVDGLAASVSCRRSCIRRTNPCWCRRPRPDLEPGHLWVGGRYWDTTRQPVSVSGSLSADRTRCKETPPDVVSQDAQVVHAACQYWK